LSEEKTIKHSRAVLKERLKSCFLSRFILPNNKFIVFILQLISIDYCSYQIIRRLANINVITKNKKILEEFKKNNPHNKKRAENAHL
jgi:hypothetical protein